MPEMDSAFVYNRDGVAARNIMTNVSSDDIGHQKIDCTMNVVVTDAHFAECRLQSGLHRPYLELSGYVDEVFIEDNDDREFPCGTKRLTLDEDQPVRIAYIPSSTELKQLMNMGFYYPDFDVPKNLIGNRIEIPHTITYSCIYDTVVGMVGIDDPYEIETSTRENHYDGIFVTNCEVSKYRAMEDSADFKFTREEPVRGVAAYQSVLTDYFEDDLDQHESVSEQVNVEEPEDKKTIDNFASILVDANKRVAEKRASVVASAAERAKTVAAIEDEVREEAKATSKKAALSTDEYTRLMDGEGSAESNAKLNYDRFKAAMAKLHAKAQSLSADSEDGSGTAKEDLDKVQQVDKARDNQALNAGITDISGFGADESKMTDKQRAEYAAKKSNAVARRVDTALDNQALNSGATDISGFGASTEKKSDAPEKKPTSADSIRSRLLGGIPKPSAPSTDDGPGYL